MSLTAWTQTPAPSPTVEPDIAYDGQALPDNPTGRVILIKGKRYLIIDEPSFARIENAVNRLKAADGYIKKLEAERDTVKQVFGMQEKLDAINEQIRLMNVELLKAKDEVIAATERAFAASERENKVLVDQNTQLKIDKAELKSKLNKSRLQTVLVTIGAVVFAILR